MISIHIEQYLQLGLMEPSVNVNGVITQVWLTQCAHYPVYIPTIYNSDPVTTLH